MKNNNVIIGLEIHGYIETDEKLFCCCHNFHDMKKIKPNTNICPICTGQPGAKPMLTNEEAVKKIIEIGLMLNCKPTLYPESPLIFQRKHYDWPDMPVGYQKTISGAHSKEVATNGKFLGIGITEVHLEEDPAAWNPETGKIDYNRAGAPLVEIVTEPDFKDSFEVEKWLRQLVLTLSYVKAINKDSGIKADVNVSIKGVSSRTEIKNVNSIKEIVKAIESEIERHKKEKPQLQETRRWNSKELVTELMRTKENQEDYRFIPDPDLPALKITKDYVKKLEKDLPESPRDKLEKIIKKYKIDKENAKILIKNIDIASLYENIIKDVDAKFALPWITVEWFSVLNYNKKIMDDLDIKVEHFVELLKLLKNNKITPLKGKEILRQFVPKSFSPEKFAKSSGKICDEKELLEVIKKIIKDNEKSVNDYKNGEKKAMNFLMGQVMIKTEKRADYIIARNILEKELS